MLLRRFEQKRAFSRCGGMTMRSQKDQKYAVSEGNISVRMLEGDTVIHQKADILDLSITRLLDCEFKLDVMSKREGEPLYYSSTTFQKTTAAEIVFDHSSFPLSPRMHAHDYFEIILLDKGPVTLQVETVRKVYHPGDVLIINRAARHTEDLLENADMYSICISCGCLRSWLTADNGADQLSKTLSQFITTNTADDFKPSKEMIEYLYIGDASRVEAVRLLQEVRMEMNGKKPGYRLMVRALIYRFFALLGDQEQYREIYSDLGRNLDENLAESVKLFLDNTKRKVTRSEVSAVMHYSDNHVNRIFKAYYNMTVMEYNRQIYMKEAAKLLSTTDMPVSEIVSVLKLESKTHFYRNFAEVYAMTPTQYRTKMKGPAKEQL